MLENLEIFCAERSPMRAEVRAQLEAPALAGAKLAGELHGPFSAHARTLPHVTPFVAAEPGAGLQSRAALLDPCYWTPDVPALYEVRMRLVAGEETQETLKRKVGFRDLAIDGTGLRMGSDSWRLTAVGEELADSDRLSRWREAGASLYAVDPPDELLERASQEGVLVVARVTARGDDLPSALRRIARHAAAGIVVVSGGQSADDDLRRRAPNILFAQASEDTSLTDVSPWAHLVLIGARGAGAAGRLSTPAGRPYVVAVPADSSTDLSAIIAAAENSLSIPPDSPSPTGWIALAP